MCCPESGTYCNNCKHQITSRYNDYTCKIHYHIKCNSNRRWKKYIYCRSINVNNDCKKYEPSFIRRVYLFFKRDIGLR